MECSVVGCEQVAKKRGWCRKHYQRWKRHGDPLLGEARQCSRICVESGCGEVAVARDLCGKHYQRWSKYGDSSVEFGKGNRLIKGDRLLSKRERDGLLANQKWQCSSCYRVLDLTEFYGGIRPGRNTPNTACKLCCRLRRHHVTYMWYLETLAKQQGKCALDGCEAIPDTIDHDHSCCFGEASCGDCVRGLICHNHNAGLGHFHDDPSALRAAARYLEQRGK